MEAPDSSIFSQSDVKYGDVRILQSEIQQVAVRNGEVQYFVTGYETGAGVRILRGGSWGFSSTTDVSAAALARAVQRAQKVCLPRHGQGHLAPVEPEVQMNKAPVTAVTNDDLVLISKELESIVHYSSQIRRGEVQLRYNNTAKQFFNTEGSHIEQNLVHIMVELVATASGSGKLSESRFFYAFTSLESLRKASLAEKFLETAEEAARGLDVGNAPRGQFSVILGPSLASIFIHEAVGHRMEADEVVRYHALMKGKEGKLITHPSLTVVDTMNNTQVLYRFDDEGVPKKETVLIEKGRVAGFLHDRQTAYQCETSSTGNSRASSYHTEPLPRMTNTKALKGNMSCEEMIEECFQGIFLNGFVGGAALPDGTFRFIARMGRFIKHGELTSSFGKCVISGTTLDALSCLSGVGKEVAMHYSECIKRGQGLIVGLGSPPLLISQLRVGG